MILGFTSVSTITATPENNFQGGPSLDEPTFTDLGQEAAGSSGDGYIWNIFTQSNHLNIVRFDTTDYIPVPDEWQTNSTDAPLEITEAQVVS